MLQQLHVSITEDLSGVPRSTDWTFRELELARSLPSDVRTRPEYPKKKTMGIVVISYTPYAMQYSVAISLSEAAS